MKFLRVEILFVRVKQCFVERSGRKDRTASRDYRGVARFSTTPSATHPAACRRSLHQHLLSPTIPPDLPVSSPTVHQCHCSIFFSPTVQNATVLFYNIVPVGWWESFYFVWFLSVLGGKETLCHLLRAPLKCCKLSDFNPATSTGELFRRWQTWCLNILILLAPKSAITPSTNPPWASPPLLRFVLQLLEWSRPVKRTAT